jgi:hypothetical protein
MATQAQHPPVMILGCGRSGTSIFGELFEGLGPYIYASEPPFGDVMNWTNAQTWAVKVPRESEGFFPDAGLSFPLAKLLHTHPSTMFFWIVRHPLDAICSLRIGIGQNWNHHPRPQNWEKWLDRPLIEQCAHHWTYINTQGYERVKDLARLVYFEDMIRDPHGFGLEICAALGLQREAHENLVRKWAARVQDSNNSWFVEALTSRSLSRPDHSVRIGRWKENLSVDDARVAARIVGDAAQTFGYDLGALT